MTTLDQDAYAVIIKWDINQKRGKKLRCRKCPTTTKRPHYMCWSEWQLCVKCAVKEHPEKYDPRQLGAHSSWDVKNVSRQWVPIQWENENAGGNGSYVACAVYRNILMNTAPGPGVLLQGKDIFMDQNVNFIYRGFML